jgi:hypothetical protein
MYIYKDPAYPEVLFDFELGSQKVQSIMINRGHWNW